MAKNRSRRLRKKMHIDEFQELGFSVAWRFPEGTSEEQIDKTVDDFINEVIEPTQYNFLFSFIWNIANDVLVNAFNKGDYKKVILPMLVLRLIDVLLEPTKDAVIQMKEQLDNKSFQNTINERVFQQVYSKVSQGL